MTNAVDIIRPFMDKGRNMYGRSLSGECRERIAVLMEDPSIDNWDDAHGIIVGRDGWMTLWQAICKVDPNFPRTGRRTTIIDGAIVSDWPEVPTRGLILRALNYATSH